jgi:hypothetical protein
MSEIVTSTPVQAKTNEKAHQKARGETLEVKYIARV